MIDFSNYLYVPALRTRKAELKGLAQIADDPYGSGLLPLFEFTRSRRTKKNPEGAVQVSVDDVLQVVESAYFIADITTLDSLTNSEIERLLNPDNEFKHWREFVGKSLPATAVPVVHLTDPFDPPSTRKQIDEFLDSRQAIAFRIPSEFAELDELVELIEEAVDDPARMAVFADVGLVTERGYRGALARVREVGEAFSAIAPGLLSSLASSFPSTVTPFGDVRGSFALHEVSLSDFMKGEFEDMHCVHGDYGCIHPRDMEGTAMNWVPRIDVPLNESLYYYRYRRHEGGYVRAAEAVLKDRQYEAIKCWSDECIRSAAGGEPPGKAPAFWISARVNFHIERQLIRLGA